MDAPASLLQPEEDRVLAALVAAWNAYVELPVEHKDDQDEFRHGLHHLQAMILMRPARRALKKDNMARLIRRSRGEES